MKIVLTDAATVFDAHLSPDRFRALGEVTAYDMTDPGELIDRLRGADVLLCNKTPVSAAVMEAVPELKYVGLFATGFNNIDVAYAAAHGVTVCNVPGYSTEAVAQHTFALLLALVNRAEEYRRTVEKGDWVRSRTFSYFPLPLIELCGKTIGIVGYGAIGRRVAAIARAFGMRVVVRNRRPVDDPAVEQVSLETLLEQADVVTLHCPLNADSQGMMDAAAFARMKPGSYFINTARGGLVDENALRDALISGHLAGAGVDVVRREPMEPDCPLLGAPRCVITPHVAWAGVETRRRLLDVVENNLRAFLAGNPVNVVKG
ncbi:MAG: D-2-hydroxyacid dehydrogenase [Acutalibacteraceae bacterium]|jgi:glycerate dehydrogenase